MTDPIPLSKRDIKSHSSATTVRVTLPLPPHGQVEEVEFASYGLRVLVERLPQETQEQLRGRFVVTAPIGSDNRMHAARLGTGVLSPKKLGVTLCTEGKATGLASDTRINGLGLETVTCVACKTNLTREGIELPTKEG